MKKEWPKWLLISAFILSTVLGGNNAIAVRFSNAEIPPFFGGALRLTTSSLLLFGIVAIMGLTLPKGRSLLGAMVFGALQYGVSYALIYWSLVEVPAGMFQIFFALVPLLTFLLAIFHGQEEFKWRILVGGLVSLIGVAVVFREGVTSDIPLLPLLGGVVVAFCFGESMILFKSLPDNHPITTNAIAMGVGGLFLLSVSTISGEQPILPSLTTTWLAVIYLILFGSITTFVLSFFVLKHWKASITSYQLVLLPFVTMIFASLLTDEEITGIVLVGGFLVLLGVFIGALVPESYLDRVLSIFRNDHLK